MIDIVFYFQVHQPYRLRGWLPEDRIEGLDYFDEPLNRLVAERVAERCYLPMNKVLLDVIERTDGEFRCAFSLSGTVVEQLRDWVPEAIDSFVALAETGNVEFLGETRYHSLASLGNAEEFAAQVTDHCETIEQLFGARPTAFRNTELILSNEIAQQVEALGFEVMLGEGADRILGWRSPQVPYRAKGCAKMPLLLRSYSLSDDIAFRFSNPDWPGHPLFADSFAQWLHEVPEPAQFVGLYMDYETFGEHQHCDTGIFEFMRHLPEYVLEDERFRFRTPTEVARDTEAVGELDIAQPMSWADEERNVSAWLGNPMQQAAHRALYDLRGDVVAAAAERPELLAAWHRLSTSDQVYYMATKQHSDAEVHEYFSPFGSPHAAFVAMMTAVDDLRRAVQARPTARRKPRRKSRSRGPQGA
ncbi:MAG: glycoside hydrolase family 57 protein [Planctomycetota bacterium]|nr:glycoside hydrolase family 57 protein [Planctomycetota bacterium]